MQKPVVCQAIAEGATSCPHVSGCDKLVDAYLAGYDDALSDLRNAARVYRGDLHSQATLNAVVEIVLQARRTP